jgi:hypothetical protein
LPGIVLAADQDDGGVRAEPPDLVNPHVPKKINISYLSLFLTYTR